MSNSKIVIFDFFGVISSEVAPFWLKKYFDETTAEQIKEDIIGKADVGIYSEDEMFKRLSLLTGVSKEKIKNDWLKLAVIDKQMINFVKKCALNFRVALLSNAPSEFLHTILKRTIYIVYLKKLLFQVNKKLKNLLLKFLNIHYL